MHYQSRHRDLLEVLSEVRLRESYDSIMRLGNAQHVPYADSAPLSAKLVKGAVLKTYKGFPHAMPTTNADEINADLLAFIKGEMAATA